VRALLLVTERRFDDDDDDDAAASEMGELFSTTKAKVSLSLFLSSTKHPTARVREKNFFIPLYENEEASL
jgi:hypothetical protein